MRSRNFIALAALALASAAAGIVLARFLGTGAPPATGPQIRGDFSLVRDDGRTIDWRDTAGALRLVFFGFTHCPDTCPVLLGKVASALDGIGPRAAAVRVYFITVDPERDTPAVLRAYAAPFGGRVVGFTGSGEQIAAAAKAFGVYYRKLPMAEHGDYMMEHSATLFVVDAGGGLRELIPADTGLRDFTMRLRAYVR